MSKLKTRKKEFEKKIADYRRFLKNDFDWDYNYILKLLQYKLSRTRKCIVSNDVIVGAKKVGREIDQVEALLGRVIDDRYYEDISKGFRKKYGQLKMIMHPVKKGESSGRVTFRYKNETETNSVRIHRESSILWSKADKMKRRDLKRAFDLMYKHIWGWWD